jgi:hypothetical protein
MNDPEAKASQEMIGPSHSNTRDPREPQEHDGSGMIGTKRDEHVLEAKLARVNQHGTKGSSKEASRHPGSKVQLVQINKMAVSSSEGRDKDKTATTER